MVTYFRQSEEGGIEALKDLDDKGQSSQLNQQMASLKAYFEAHPPRPAAAAQAEIEQITGIKRSPTQIKAFIFMLFWFGVATECSHRLMVKSQF